MNWYIEVFKKYTDFNGRARRTEFWMFVLFNFIIAVVFNILTRLIGFLSFFSLLYSLAVLCPAIAVGTRRLHDTNRSGWWQLIGLIPLVGWIVLIIFCAQEGEAKDNQYGPNPKAV